MPISFINQRNPRLYLASRSPRRRELLTQIGVQFDTIVFRDPPREDKELDETPLAGESAVAYVERVAQPSLPDDALEPRRLRGILATFVIGLVAWGILTLLLAGVREHRN